MKINLILPPSSQGGILEKFAIRLKENIPFFGCSVDIREIPDHDADINHWMIYHIAKGDHLPGSFLITHVDSIYRVLMIKQAFKTTDIGICLSNETQSFLVEKGIPAEKTCFITPATDGDIKPRKIIIGLTTNIYDNHCKREDILLDAIKKTSMDLIRFEIFGKGWENIICKLEASGVEVYWERPSSDYIKDYQKIKQRLPNFDYYLYMGLDEGSMGFLDSLAAGIPTIVTPQGFHLDIPGGITYPFLSAAQLAEILNKLQQEKRARVASVKEKTWYEYTRQHMILWEAILKGYGGNYQELLHKVPSSTTSTYPKRKLLVQEKLIFYFRPIRNLLARIHRK